MRIREMTPEDVEYMKDHSASRGILKNQPERIEFCYALEYEGKLLCVGGIRMINISTAWCWVDLSDNAADNIRNVYRSIKEWMLLMVSEHNIKRLQAYIEPDFPEAVRMVQHLGFHKESILEKFLADGRDANLFVRLF